MNHDEWKRYLWARDGGYCQLCGGPAVDPHHILSRSLGGKDDPWNGILLCRPCHDRAQQNQVSRAQLWGILYRRGVLKEEWLDEIERWIDGGLRTLVGG